MKETMKKKLMLIVSIFLLIVGSILLFIDMRENNNTARTLEFALLIIASLLNNVREFIRMKNEGK